MENDTPKGLKVAKGFKQKAGTRLLFEAPVGLEGSLSLLCGAKIGAFTNLGSGRIKGLKVIGRYSTVSDDVKIGYPPALSNWLSTSAFQYAPARFGWFSDEMAKLAEPGAGKAKAFLSGPVVIGHDVWIGAGVQILRGVTIGSGAIIESGSVVRHDVAPYEIVGGVPATRQRLRFSPAVVDRLLALAWWQYHPLDFAGIDFADIESAITEIERRRDAGTLHPWEGEWRILKDGQTFDQNELS